MQHQGTSPSKGKARWNHIRQSLSNRLNFGFAEVVQKGEAIISRASFVVIASMALCACALSPGGRMQMTAPASVSAVYSEIDMKLALVTEGDTDSTCIEECKLDHAFEQRILVMGTRLANAAFETYPELAERFDKFKFVIAEKNNPGSTSSAAGTVAIFRGVQNSNRAKKFWPS